MTWCLITVNVLWYLIIERLFGHTPSGFVRAGALASVTGSPEWTRLFSAMFVHFSVIHITLNMISLASLRVVEALFGPWRFLLMYTVSGVAGNLLTAMLMTNTIAGGASGAIFGVFGSALVLSFRGAFGGAARNQLIVLLGINLVYDFLSPNVDTVGHFGGLAAGMLLTAVYTKISRNNRGVRVLGWVSGALIVIALIQIVTY